MKTHRSWLYAILLLRLVSLELVSTAQSTPVPGDLFSEPIEMSGLRWVWQGRNRRATNEPSERPHLALLATLGHPIRSIWFRWTAPASGLVGIACAVDIGALHPVDVFPRDPSSGVTVYEDGQAVSPLVRIAQPGHGRTVGSTTVFEAVAGRVYRMALDGLTDETMSPLYRVHLIQPALAIAPHDTLATAEWITDLEMPVPFDLSRATVEPGEPGFGTWSSPRYESSGLVDFRWNLQSPQPRGGNSLWYLWKAPRSGRYGADVAMANNFPQLAVFRVRSGDGVQPDFESLELVERRENGSASLTPTGSPSHNLRVDMATRVALSFEAIEGEVFAIQVDQLAPARDFKVGGWPRPRNTWMQPLEHSFGSLRITSERKNDDFADAMDAVPWGSPSVFTRSASLEPGEPAMQGAAGSLWWRWTAPSNHWAGVAPRVDVFAGDQLASLQPVPLMNPSTDPRFQAVAGTVYHFRTTPRSEDYTTIDLIAEKPNNRLESAMEIPWGRWSASVPVGITSIDPGEPELIDGRNSGILWYRWTPGKRGRFSLISTSPLHVYRGRAADPVQEMGIGSPFGVVWDAEPGETVTIAQEAGRNPARIHFYGLAPNDDFLNAIPLPITYSERFPFVSATTEPDEPDHAGSPARASVWYSWPAEAVGRYGVIIQGPGSPRAAIYQGDSLATLQPVASVQVPAGAGSSPILYVDGVPGQPLRLAIEPGRLEELNPTVAASVQLFCAKVPANDNVGSAAAFFGTMTSGTTFVATSEPLDDQASGRPGQATVWYRNTLAVSRPHFARVTSTKAAYRSERSIQPSVMVFRGTGPGNLVPIARSAPPGRWGPTVATFDGIAGETVYIQVASERNQPDSFELELGPIPRPVVTGPLSVSPSSSGTIRVSGNTGQFVRLEVSRDLTRWETWGDAVLSESAAWVNVQAAMDDRNTFVRARSQ